MSAATYVGQGTAVAVTTSAGVGYPASFAAGDVLLLFVASDSATIGSAPVGWNDLNGGGIQSGGGIYSRAWYRIATGSETGTQTVPVTGGTKGVALTVAYRPVGGGAVVVGNAGSDTDASSSQYSASGAGWTVAVDDVIAGFGVALAQAAGAFSASPSAQGLSNAGAVGTHTARFGARTGTNTIGYSMSDLAITSGGSGAPTHLFTAAGANACGVDQFVKISVAANVPPTVTLTGNQTVAAGATASITASASDVDGSIASYAHSVTFPTTGAPALTGANTATATFTAPAGPAVIKTQCVVTDNSGATATATTEVRVASNAASVAALPGWATVGGWANQGGAANIPAALSDASDATYAETPAAVSAVEQEIRVRLGPMTSRANLTITVRPAWDTGGGTMRARLYEGSTLRQEWTLSGVTMAFADQTLTVSAGTLAAITDWGNLWVALAATS